MCLYCYKDCMEANMSLIRILALKLHGLNSSIEQLGFQILAIKNHGIRELGYELKESYYRKV